MTAAPACSVVIPTRNSIAVLPRLMEAIARQRFPLPFEVIVLENGSTDGTAEYLRSLGWENLRVVPIAEGAFHHAETRMRGAGEARGRVVVFFTDDAVPIGDDFLLNLTLPVLEGIAAAACGVSQVDPERHDPVQAALYNRWDEGVSSLVEPISPEEWERLPPGRRRAVCRFDNCAACYDRETLLALRFPPVVFGEDMAFAKRLLLSGRRVALAKGARFHHWHRPDFGYTFRRMCADQAVVIDEFGFRYVRGLADALLSMVLRSGYRSLAAMTLPGIHFRDRFRLAASNAAELAAEYLGKYAGTLGEEVLSRPFSPLDKALFRFKERILEEVRRSSIGRR